MRLHHLVIQAFGPFGGVVEVDFDELNEAGQFLISGATGSGKTSILDAVCFALYGEVPGERQRAKHLRSDHASDGVEPRVTLTLTIAERLIRITRSPAWERPKRRGTGMTQQQASVRLEQMIDGEWHCLATRLDEAGHQINTWLGMTPVQFTQVALLPQGGFQTFLQSPTAARQAVLQRLFRTDRFERVERWFADFRRTLNRSRAESLHLLDVISHRLAEAAGEESTPGTDGGVDELERWAEGLGVAAREAHAQAIAERKTAIAGHAVAAKALEEATVLTATLDRAETAQRQLDELAASEADFERDTQALRAHEHARSLAPLIEASRQAIAAAEIAGQEATARLREVGADASPEDLDQLLACSIEDVQRAEQALALDQRLHAVQGEHDAARAAWETATEAVAKLREVAESLPHQQAAVQQELHHAVEAQLELAACAVELSAATQRLEAARDLETVRRDLVVKTELRRAEQNRVQDLRQAYQDAREARIEAMASELAGSLAAGCSCPVCGSTSHPAPASRVAGVGRRAEESARRKYESAGVELAALDEVIAGCRARIATLSRTAQDVKIDEAQQQVAELREREALLVERGSAIASLRDRSAALEERSMRVHAEIDALAQTEIKASLRLEVLAAQTRTLQSELADLLGEYPDASTYAKTARDATSRIRAAATACRAHREAETAAAQQTASLDLQAASVGFPSGAAAERAVLADERADEIGHRQRERTQARLAALTVLADPAVAESRARPRPDMAALETAAHTAEKTLTVAHMSAEVAATRVERMEAIAVELRRAVTDYRPLEQKAAQVSALSGLLEGTGVDNRLKMRLSAFVLAERLRQVIDAANARLDIISEGRYLLSYQEERGAGDSRGGLSLSVLDEWTGVRRDPSTLSGGETFVVSLCLALGLADTVADESGGLRIDTLFIDEGFGSLDAQTLDSVIDILGQLSQGGRVTGVVSHVQELRERLPAVLEVVHSKQGSTVRRASA